MADNFNFNSEELAILAPKQNPLSGAFKGSVSMGATIFFAEKIIGKLSHSKTLLAGNLGAYGLLAGLVGGAAAGAYGADRYNSKLEKFTERLKKEEQKSPARDDLVIGR